jgi:hypothetical protein
MRRTYKMRLTVLALALVTLSLALAPTLALADTSAVAPVVGQTPENPGPFFGQNVTVDEDEVYQQLIVFGGNADVRGVVDGPVVMFGGNVVISGTVDEEIVAFGGNVTLESTARVGAGLAPDEDGIVLFGGNVTQEPGAQVTGEVRRMGGGDLAAALRSAAGAAGFEPFRQFYSVGGWLFTTLVFLVLGLVAAALLPNQMRAVQRQLAARPWPSLGWGALTFFVIVPVTIVALVISLIGILVLIPGIPTLLLAYFFAVVSVGTLIADRFVAGRVSERNRLFLATTIGVVATAIVSAVPFFGGLLILAMMVFGTGAALLAVGDWRRQRKLAAVVPPGAPLPPGTPAPSGTWQQPAGTPGAEPGQPWQPQPEQQAWQPQPQPQQPQPQQQPWQPQPGQWQEPQTPQPDQQPWQPQPGQWQEPQTPQLGQQPWQPQPGFDEATREGPAVEPQTAEQPAVSLPPEEVTPAPPTPVQPPTTPEGADEEPPGDSASEQTDEPGSDGETEPTST